MSEFLVWVILIISGIYLFKVRSDNAKLTNEVFWLANKVSHLESDLRKLFKPPSSKQAEHPVDPVPIEETTTDGKDSDTSQLEDTPRAPDPVYKTASSPETLTVPTTKVKSNFQDMESDLSSRWMIWIGGIAFALGGAFLVKYSIDAGLMKPAVRVSLGTVIGIALTVFGEAIRQRRSKIEWLAGTPDYLPSAISAAGLFTAFAAIYSSYALYDLISPLVAFAALALLSFASSGLALYQGRFFAYLGMIGGLIIPMLVSTGSGDAWALFPYLLVITGSSLWVAREKNWIDIAGATLLLSMLWVIIWIFTNWKADDIIPVGLYLLILSTLNVMFLSGASPSRSENPTLAGLMPEHGVTYLSDAVTLLSVLLLVAIVRLDHYSATAFILVSVGLAGQAFAISRSAEHDAGGIIAIIGVIFLMGTWHLPDLFELQTAAGFRMADQVPWAPIIPPSIQTFISACLSFSAIIGVAIFMRLPFLLRQPLWATISNILPLTILVIAYGRTNDFGTSIPFAMTALALGVLYILGASYLNKQSGPKAITPVAAYAAGATTALALALTMLLKDAWLSFALALELVALAYIWQKTAVRGLRHLALILALIVLSRLFLNDSIFDYHEGPIPIFNWLFYGYGLTAVLFAVAARMFNEQKERDRLISILTAGSIMLFIGFITLEIRVLFSDDNTLTSGFTKLEIALQTINWSVATTVLMWREIKDKDPLIGKLRRFMTIVSLIGLVMSGGFTSNIFFEGVDIGSMIIFNLQFLLLLIPACLFGLKAYLAYKANRSRSLKLYGTVAFLTLWYWISAEVHHAYYPDGGSGAISDWEGYSYSLAWLLYAIGLLVLGLHKNIEKIRMAGLGVLSIVVLKVFLIDMSTLEGLSRALSFMGLGAALIGIGYLYQRMKALEISKLNDAS